MSKNEAYTVYIHRLFVKAKISDLPPDIFDTVFCDGIWPYLEGYYYDNEADIYTIVLEGEIDCITSDTDVLKELLLCKLPFSEFHSCVNVLETFGFYTGKTQKIW